MKIDGTIELGDNVYKLGDDASITMLIGNYPNEFTYIATDPIVKIGSGVIMSIKFNWYNPDASIREVRHIIMTKEQAEAIIKGLKMEIKRLRQ